MNNVEIPTKKLRRFKLIEIPYTTKEGETDFQIFKEIGGVLLIPRKWFIENVASSQHQVDYLANQGHLTSYNANGKPKQTVNGRKKSSLTYYDLRQWLDLDLDQT